MEYSRDIEDNRGVTHEVHDVYYVRFCDLQCAIRWLELDIVLRAAKHTTAINLFPLIPKKVGTQMDLLTSLNTENGTMIGSTWSTIRQIVKLFCSDIVEGVVPNYALDIYDFAGNTFNLYGIVTTYHAKAILGADATAETMRTKVEEVRRLCPFTEHLDRAQVYQGLVNAAALGTTRVSNGLAAWPAEREFKAQKDYVSHNARTSMTMALKKKTDAKRASEEAARAAKAQANAAPATVALGVERWVRE